MYRFVERCCQSENSLVTALIHSASYFHSKYSAHYCNFLSANNEMDDKALFFEDSLPQYVCLYIDIGLVLCVFFMLLFCVSLHYVNLLLFNMDQIN